MRNLLLTIALIFTAELGYGQFHAKVDPRFELTSITARLAKYPEYSECYVPAYNADMDTWFKPYTRHPLIAFLKRERAKHHVAFDAIALAAHAMEFNDDKFEFNPEKLAAVLELDDRWSKKTMARYIKLLNDFYYESRFAEFYAQHVDFYALATERMDAFSTKILDAKWFEQFYGTPFGEPGIYLSFTNGQNNYGLISLDGSDYGILAICAVDKNGDPAYDGPPGLVLVVVHELNHNFANPLAFEFAPQMAAAVDSIAPKIAQWLDTTDYEKASILPEWFTRLGVLMYLHEKAPEIVPMAIAWDMQQGFIWQQRAYDFMVAEFLPNRDRYPHFRDFMPRLVEFFNSLPADFDEIVAEYDNFAKD